MTMNPDWLLKHFGQISEGPDAVPRLRRFILDLAVRGKLVEQNPKEEPASELLKRIGIEKERLVKTSKLRNHQTQLLDEEQIVYTIPSAWSWTQLAQIGIINPQNDIEDNAEASFVPMRMIYAEYKRANEHEIRPWGEIRKGFTHFADGDVGLAKITPCFENGKSTVFRNLTGGIGAGTTELHIVRPIFVNADYILIFLKSSHFIQTGISRMTGTAGQKRVPRDYFAFSPFPLPPVAEQHRIVAKVAELMALCDGLEAAQAKREKRRDRLVAATLHGLNNGDDSSESGDRPTFEESGHFYFNHLPRLTTRPEHIQQLRQTILNLTVRGKLVPQRTEEGSGEELLYRVKAGHPENRKFGASRRKSRSLLDQLNCPGLFPVPPTWRWAYLDFLCEQIADIDHNMPKTVADGVPFISAKDLKDDGTIDFSNPKMISEDDYERLSRKVQIRYGDVVYSRIGARLGKARIVSVDTRFLISYSCCLVRPMHGFVDKHYLQRFLDSNLALNQAHKGAQSIGVPDLGLGEIKEFRIPLPPLAEQQRIVAKVNELMALCDELEKHITSTATTRVQLLEASLQETLKGEI
jgi:type I restriction enzyme S subunit